MPSVSELTAGKAVIKLSLLGSDKVDKALANLQSKVSSFSSGIGTAAAGLAAVGGIITGAFAGALTIFNNVGSGLADMSARTGVAVETLSELKFAAEQTGTSLGDVEKALKKMAQNGDSRNFFDVARSIAAISDPTLRAHAAMEAWGKSGVMLIPMLSDLDALREKAQKLGLVWSGEMASGADRVGDALDAVKAQGLALASALGNAVAPYVSAVLEASQEYVAVAIQWIKNNPNLVAGVAALGVALTAAGVVLGTFAVAITSVLAGIAGLTAAIGFLVASPVGLLVAGVGALALAINAVLIVALVKVTSHFVDWKKAIQGVTDKLNNAIKLFAQLQKLRGIANNFSGNMKIMREAKVTHDFGNIGTGSLPGFFAPTFDPSKLSKEYESKKFWDRENVALQHQGGAAGMFGPMMTPLNLLSMTQKGLLQAVNTANATAQEKAAAVAEAQASVATETTKSEAIFDTRFAAQMFGGGNDELEQLKIIAKNTRPRFNIEGAKIPVGP